MAAKSVTEMKKLIWAKVESLREARRKAFVAHEKRIQAHPPRFDCDRGCAEAAEIAGQIEHLIEAGKMLGLIAKKVDYSDYL